MAPHYHLSSLTSLQIPIVRFTVELASTESTLTLRRLLFTPVEALAFAFAAWPCICRVRALLLALLLLYTIVKSAGKSVHIKEEELTLPLNGDVNGMGKELCV